MGEGDCERVRGYSYISCILRDLRISPPSTLNAHVLTDSERDSLHLPRGKNVESDILIC